MNISDYDGYWLPSQPPVMPKHPSIIVDPSLSLAGQAADARVVGLQLQAYTGELNTAKSSIENVSTSLAEVSKIVEAVQQSGNASKEDIELVRGLVNDLKVEIGKASTLNSCQSDRIKELISADKDVQNQIKAIDTRIDALVADIPAQFDHFWHEHIKDFANQVDELEDRIIVLETKLDSFDDIKKRLADAEQSINDIKKKIESHITLMNECKAEIKKYIDDADKRLTKDIQNVSDKADNLDERVTALENASDDSLNDRVTALENAMTDKADKEDLDAKADKSELELKADKTELDSKADKADLELKADKEELDSKADKEVVDAIADDVDELKSDMDNVESSLEDVKDSVDGLSSRVDNLESDTEELESKVEDLIQKLADNEKADDELADRVSELEEKANNALTGVELNGELADVDNGIAKLNINIDVIEQIAQYIDASTGVSNFTDALTQQINNAIRDIDGGDLEESEDVNEDMDGGDLG